MMIKFNGSRYHIPTGYATMDWGMYTQLDNVLDDIELVSIITGLSYDVIKKSNDNVGFYMIITAMGFLKSEPKPDDAPTLITRHNVIFNTPKSFESVELGQYEDIKRVILDEDMKLTDKITTVVAIGGMQGTVGVYDSAKMEQSTEMVNRCTVESVLSTYAFFLRSLNGSRNGTLKTWLVRVIHRMRLWLALKTWSGSVS